jgi:hypothetical protein
MRVRVKKNKASTDGKYVFLNTQKYIIDTFTRVMFFSCSKDRSDNVFFIYKTTKIPTQTTIGHLDLFYLNKTAYTIFNQDI